MCYIYCLSISFDVFKYWQLTFLRYCTTYVAYFGSFDVFKYWQLIFFRYCATYVASQYLLMSSNIHNFFFSDVLLHILHLNIFKYWQFSPSDIVQHVLPLTALKIENFFVIFSLRYCSSYIASYGSFDVFKYWQFLFL